jgi:hypothetical protein
VRSGNYKKQTTTMIEARLFLPWHGAGILAMKQGTKGVAAVLILTGCDVAPTAPPAPPPSELQPALSAPVLLLLAPPQQVLIQRAERDSEPARFQAEIVLKGFDPGGHARAPAAAGAIRLESASDGLLQIQVLEARVGAYGAVHFEGLARLWTERGESVAELPIAGSARPEPGNPDCIIWDIVGGKVYDRATFSAEGRLFTTGG